MANRINKNTLVIWIGGKGHKAEVEFGLLINYSSDFSTDSHGPHGIAYSGGMKANIQVPGGKLYRLPPNALRKDTAANRIKLTLQASQITKARKIRLAANGHQFKETL